MRPTVLVSGPPATRSGYGAHARDLIHALIEMDRFDIHINSLRWGNTPMNALNDKDPKDKLIIDRLLKENTMPSQPDIHFQISVPNEFSPIGKYNIGVTAGIENTTPKAEWLEGLNRMDMNIAVSEFVKNTFETLVYDKLDEKTKQKVFSWLYDPNKNEEELEKVFKRGKVLQKHFDGCFVSTPFGRKIKSDDYHALNYLIQSTSSDLFLRQVIKIFKMLDGKKSKIAFTIHDSVVLDFAKEDQNLLKDLIQAFKETNFGIFKVNISGGKNFGEMKNIPL